MPRSKMRVLLLGLTIAGMLGAGCDTNPAAPTPIPAVPSATPAPAVGTLLPTALPATATPAALPATATLPASATPVPATGTAAPLTPPATATAAAPLLRAPTATPEPLVTPAVYDTRAQRISLPSRTLGISKDFYIYTPPGYAQATAARYPVLYLFRGHEREWINKHEDSSRAGRNVIDVYESLLAAKQVGPLILVFPGISSTDDTIPGLLTNFRAPQLAGVAGIGTGRFEDYFVQELLPYVDSHYRTVASREGRGVDGFSLGGFMSTKIAAQHPDLFRTVGAFDGLYFYADSTCHGIDTARESLLTVAMFWPVFGNPPDLAFAAANNPPNLICRSPGPAIQGLHWFIQYGPESAEPNNSNYYRGVHLLQQLQLNDVPDGIAPILTGGHRWATADEHMRLTLPLHWAVLGPAATR